MTNSTYLFIYVEHGILVVLVVYEFIMLQFIFFYVELNHMLLKFHSKIVVKKFNSNVWFPFNK